MFIFQSEFEQLYEVTYQDQESQPLTHRFAYTSDKIYKKYFDKQ